MSVTKNWASSLIFFKKIFGKIWPIFDTEKWLWKSEFCNLWVHIHNQVSICWRTFELRKCKEPRVWCRICWKFIKWYSLSIHSTLQNCIYCCKKWQKWHILSIIIKGLIMFLSFNKTLQIFEIKKSPLYEFYGLRFWSIERTHP